QSKRRGSIAHVASGFSRKFNAGDYTFLSFQRPRRNSATLTSAIVEYATAMDQKTPVAPKPSRWASAYATGSSHSQKQKTLITVGVSVSPAPLNEFVSTMAYA